MNPLLLRERSSVLIHRGQPLTDRLLLLSFMGTAFIGLPIVAAVDVFHWHLRPTPPMWLSAAGLLLYIAGWTIIAFALRANAFAVTVVRLQPERQQRVVDSGPYAIIRHPMYAANPLVNFGLALWLGSYVALACAIIPLALLMTRLVLEERFLRRELPTYGDYLARVRYRVLPGVW